jgi:uncharacterized protein (TIRG00374 family)
LIERLLHAIFLKNKYFQGTALSKTETQSRTSFLSILIRVGVALAACGLIFHTTDTAELAQTFKRLSVCYFLLAIIVFMGALCLIALRWWVFMRAQNLGIPLFMAIKLTFLGQFFTNFMPSAVGGDLIRAWYVSRQTHKKLQSALGVAADRIIGLISIVILAAFCYVVFMKGRVEIFHVIQGEGQGTEAITERIDFSMTLLVIVSIFVLGCLFVCAGFYDVRQLLKKLYGKMKHLLCHMNEVLSVYVKHPLILIFGLGTTIFLQSMVILTFWLLGRNLGMDVPIQHYFVFFPIMWVFGALPLSIAGIGIVEGGLVLLFVQFSGAEQETATALAFCQRFIWVLASLPGMVVHLTGAHRHQ